MDLSDDHPTSSDRVRATYWEVMKVPGEIITVYPAGYKERTCELAMLALVITVVVVAVVSELSKR